MKIIFGGGKKKEQRQGNKNANILKFKKWNHSVWDIKKRKTWEKRIAE